MTHCRDKRIWLGLLVAALAAGAPEARGQLSKGSLYTPRGDIPAGDRLGANTYGSGTLTTDYNSSLGMALQSAMQDPYYTARAMSAYRSRVADENQMMDLHRPSKMLQSGGQDPPPEEVIGPDPEMRAPLAQGPSGANSSVRLAKKSTAVGYEV